MIYAFLPLPGILAAGTGKTLMMVRMVKELLARDTKNNNQRELLSNMHFTHIPYTKVIPEIFKDTEIKKQTFAQKILVIDELQEWIDSRAGSSKQALRIQKNLFLQNRHQDTDILYSAQGAHIVDKRIWGTTAYIFYCQPIEKENPTHFKCSVYSNVSGKFLFSIQFDGSVYFDEYNTKELVGD